MLKVEITENGMEMTYTMLIGLSKQGMNTKVMEWLINHRFWDKGINMVVYNL